MIEGDGYYELALDLDGKADNGNEKVFHFYRLAGDVNGKTDPNHAVDANDLAIISLANDANADANGDGLTNYNDSYLALRSSSTARKLKAGLPLDD
jgi:hypothetical protein